MANISPPPARERLLASEDADGRYWAIMPQPWVKWFFTITDRLQHSFMLPTYTVATLPVAEDNKGGIIYVSDGGAGAQFRGSNGTAWVNLG